MFGIGAAIRRSLRLKLVLLSIGVEIVMLGLLLGNNLRLMDAALERHAQSQVEDFRQLLDASLSLTLFQRDHASMTEMLDKLLSREDSGLKYVVVLDDKDHVYAAAGKVSAQVLPELDSGLDSALSDGIFDAEGILKLDSFAVGKVRYGVSLQGFIHTRGSLFGQGVAIASLEVFLSLMLLGFLGYVLTRHIDRVVAATRHVAAGNYEVRVNKDSEDEIGQLADHFNQMTRAVRERIEALHASEAALYAEKEKALVTLHSIGDGVVTTDRQGRVEMLNPVAEQLTGWTQQEAQGLPIEDVFVIQDETSRRPVYNPILQCLRKNRVMELADNTLLIGRDGRETPINDSAAPIYDTDGVIMGAILVFHDVSSARQMASQIAYQARHDSLTGLVNRAEFERRLGKAVESAIEEARHHVLCYMDLDQFKLVNDTCGHVAGDELLRQVTNTLKAKVRDSDTLARLGGDEFGVLLENCPITRAGEIAEQMRQAVKDRHFEWDGHVFDIGVSIGVVAIDQDCGGLAEVLSAADVACYLAKEQGRNKVYYHHQDDKAGERRQGEMRLVSKISSALLDNRFQLFVQEIKPLQEQEEGRHFEVLLRMVGEQGELLPPISFIPAAERFHLMHQLDRWVVRQTLATIKHHGLHKKHMVFSINLSGQTLAQDDFLPILLDEIRHSGVPPQCLCFEITETAAISNLGHAANLISELKRLGCTFALDDFGSGLSSFAYLKNLNVDFLKIDGGFVKDMLENETDAAMVEAINQVGHVMGLKTIAEYVESDELRRGLSRLGVDYGQGYGIHRPMEIGELIGESSQAKVVKFPRA